MNNRKAKQGVNMKPLILILLLGLAACKNVDRGPTVGTDLSGTYESQKLTCYTPDLSSETYSTTFNGFYEKMYIDGNALVKVIYPAAQQFSGGIVAEGSLISFGTQPEQRSNCCGGGLAGEVKQTVNGNNVLPSNSINYGDNRFNKAKFRYDATTGSLELPTEFTDLAGNPCYTTYKKTGSY